METHQLIVFMEIMAGQMQSFIRLVWRVGYHTVSSMVLVTAYCNTTHPDRLFSPQSFTTAAQVTKPCEYPVAGLTSHSAKKTSEPVKLALRLTCHTI
jgi:hypothetical protein